MWLLSLLIPMVAYDNYMKNFCCRVKLVSGSTGWMDKHGDEVKELMHERWKKPCSGRLTSVWVSHIFSAVNKYLAKIMNNFPALRGFHDRNSSYS